MNISHLRVSISIYNVVCDNASVTRLQIQYNFPIHVRT